MAHLTCLLRKLAGTSEAHGSHNMHNAGTRAAHGVAAAAAAVAAMPNTSAGTSHAASYPQEVAGSTQHAAFTSSTSDAIQRLLKGLEALKGSDDRVCLCSLCSHDAS